MQQDTVNEFHQVLILDLDMQCVKSLTVMVGICCVITWSKGQKHGVFQCQITMTAPLYQQTFVTWIHLVWMKLGVFTVRMLFLSWAQSGDTMSHVQNNHQVRTSPQYVRNGNALVTLMWCYLCFCVSWHGTLKKMHLMISEILHDCMHSPDVDNEFHWQEMNGSTRPFPLRQCY